MSNRLDPAVTSEATGSVEYFRGRPNYTDLVFGFMNQVADEVYEGGKVDARCDLETFDLLNFKPSRHPPYLTALAYYWTEQSPSFRLHPQIMPVLTSDRAQWHDPDYREEDKALIRRWVESGAARIATWDYYFGAPYPYPRQFTQWIGESITYLHEAGVDVFFSQLPAVWGLDGPKAWLTAELLRDPERDVQGLLDEFYREFFGAAAEPIRAFYETAEQTRNKRAGTANWIKFYKDEAGVELLDEATLMQMRAYLEEAKHAVRPERLRERASASGAPLESNRFADRVQVVSDAFAYTEAYASYHRRRVALVERAIAILNGNPTAAGEQQPVKASRSPLHDPVRRQGPPQGSPELAPSTENDALKACGGAALVQALAEYAAAKKSFDALKKELVKKPLHQGFSAFNRLKQSDPVPLALAALSKTESGLALGPDARAVATRASEGGGAGHHARNELEALRAWRNGDAEWVPAGKNPGLSHAGTERRNFLGPEIPAIDAWEIEYRASEGLAVDAAAGQSAAGLRIENADIVSLAQTYPVVGEKTYLLEIEANWRVSPDNRTRVQLNWESVGGDKLRTDIPLRLPNGTSAGGQRLQFVVTSPVNAYDLKLGIVTNRQYEGDFLEMTRVELGELVSEW